MFKFFWKNRTLSQWGESQFEINGIVFSHAEQGMMFGKKVLFNDYDRATLILNTKHPRDQKDLGRGGAFDQPTWDFWKRDLVYTVNFYKFTQNKHLLQDLLSYPKDCEFVEASPYDKVWGIGLVDSDNRCKQKETWLGENLLGQILTDLRNDLVNNTIPHEKIKAVEDMLSTYLNSKVKKTDH